MKALIIDTSYHKSYIIIVKDYKVSDFKKLETKNLTKHIFTDLKDILNEQNIDLKDLSYIASSIGPGAFTSLRIGASICKTISFVHNIPIITYEYLLAILPNDDAHYLSILDAKSDGIYLMEAQVENNMITKYFKPKLILLNELEKFLDEKKIIISSDYDLIKNKFENIKTKLQKATLNPYNLANFTNQKFIKKKFTDHNNFEILYLRGPKHT
jgi:tRNA threonylcarbamoyladenosine biosynthesis protein TsaB